MKLKIHLNYLLALGLTIVPPAHAEFTMWTSKAGTSVEGKMVSRTEETVTLLLKDGRTITTRIDGIKPN
jgi:hypothetical protein